MIIDGRNFNVTQTGKNAFVSNVQSAKEAQELFQTLKNSTEHTTLQVNFSDNGKMIYHFNYENNDGFVNADGSIGYIKLNTSTESKYVQEYTAQQALETNWSLSTGNTRFLTGYRGDASVKSDEVVGMNQEQFLDYVRENGLDKEINWGRVEQSFDISTEFKDFTAYTDHTAALYASIEQRINNDFSGEERTAQLEQLNKAFDTAVEKLATRYTDTLDNTFSSFGAELPREELEQSIRDIMSEKKDAYRSFVKQNNDFASLANSEDKWLERDFNYMTSELKKAYSSETVESTSGGFSENDIISLGIIAHQYRYEAEHMDESYDSSHVDEESIGMAVAMNHLTTLAMFDDMGAGDSVRKIGETFLKSYTDSVIDKQNMNLAVGRSWDTGNGEIAKKFEPLRSEDIYKVVDKMVNTYTNSKDASKAIQETAAFAYNQHYVNKSNPEIQNLARYNKSTETPEQNFWHEFYDDGRGTSFMGKLSQKWNNYATALENKDYGKLSTYSSNLFQRYESLVHGLFLGI